MASFPIPAVLDPIASARPLEEVVPLPPGAPEWQIRAHIDSFPEDWRPLIEAYCRFDPKYRAETPGGYCPYDHFNAVRAGRPYHPNINHLATVQPSAPSASRPSPCPVPPSPPRPPASANNKRERAPEAVLSPNLEAARKRRKQAVDDLLDSIDSDAIMEDDKVRRDVEKAISRSKQLQDNILKDDDAMMKSKEKSSALESKLEEVRTISYDQIADYQKDLADKDAEADREIAEAEAAGAAAITAAQKMMAEAKERGAAKKAANKANFQDLVRDEESRREEVVDKVQATINKEKSVEISLQGRLYRASLDDVPVILSQLKRLMDSLAPLGFPSLVGRMEEQISHLKTIEPRVFATVRDLPNFTHVSPEVVQQLLSMTTKSYVRSMKVSASSFAGPFADIIRVFEFLNEKQWCKNQHYLALERCDDVMERYPDGLPTKLPIRRTAHSVDVFQQMAIDFLIIKD